MPVKIAVLKETRPNERRVAMVPAVADKLIKLGVEVSHAIRRGRRGEAAGQAFKNVAFTTERARARARRRHRAVRATAGARPSCPP